MKENNMNWPFKLNRRWMNVFYLGDKGEHWEVFLLLIYCPVCSFLMNHADSRHNVLINAAAADINHRPAAAPARQRRLHHPQRGCRDQSETATRFTFSSKLKVISLWSHVALLQPGDLFERGALLHHCGWESIVLFTRPRRWRHPDF